MDAASESDKLSLFKFGSGSSFPLGVVLIRKFQEESYWPLEPAPIDRVENADLPPVLVAPT